jgi:hypothetical protein
MPRGGWRAGAGRKNLYPGKDVRLTVAVTTQAADRAHDIRERLQAQHPDVTVSVSDAVEYALELAWGARSDRVKLRSRR